MQFLIALTEKGKDTMLAPVFGELKQSSGVMVVVSGDSLADDDNNNLCVIDGEKVTAIFAHGAWSYGIPYEDGMIKT